MRSADIPLSLYVHWPWCVRKCPYCDFNSHALPASVNPSHQYINALIADLKRSVSLAQNRKLISIFIGGGTPSLIDPLELERFLDAVFSLYKTASHIEITLEANPGTVDVRHLPEHRVWRGVLGQRTRPLSGGVLRFLVQSTHPCLLGATPDLRHRPQAPFYGQKSHVILRNKHVRPLYHQCFYQPLFTPTRLSVPIFWCKVAITLITAFPHTLIRYSSKRRIFAGSKTINHEEIR